jgi:hypothetical protein
MEKFIIGDSKGTIHTNHFWSNDDGDNSEPFNILGVDRYQYIREIVGYTPVSGGFPFLRSKVDLMRICERLNRDILDKRINKPTFKVGDLIRITKSKTAWNEYMEDFHGVEEVITRIVYQDSSDCKIEFNNSGRWNWSYAFGHFRLADGPLTTPLEHIGGAVQQGKTGVTPILINVCKIN